MARPVRRDLWIPLFAAFNLILWSIVAVAVSVVAGDRLDLGLETALRRYQATAMAAWQRDPGTLQTQTGQAEAVASQEVVSRAPRDGAASPQGSVGGSPGSVVGTPTGMPGALTPSPSPTPTGGGAAAADAGPPSPELVDQPLVIADPGFANLTGLDAEMGRSVTGRAVQIRYEESSLNREIQTLLANNPDLPYHNVRIELLVGRVIVKGTINVLGFQVWAEVQGTVVALECQPRFEIESVSIGGVITPTFVRDSVKDQILQATEWYPSDYALCLDEIVLEEDGATVYGHRR